MEMPGVSTDRLAEFVTRSWGELRGLRLDIRALRGGLESAAVAEVTARFLDAQDRPRSTAFVVKALEGTAAREADIYQHLVSPHCGEIAPVLLGIERHGVASCFSWSGYGRSGAGPGGRRRLPGGFWSAWRTSMRRRPRSTPGRSCRTGTTRASSPSGPGARRSRWRRCPGIRTSPLCGRGSALCGASPRTCRRSGASFSPSLPSVRSRSTATLIRATSWSAPESGRCSSTGAGLASAPRWRM